LTDVGRAIKDVGVVPDLFKGGFDMERLSQGLQDRIQSGAVTSWGDLSKSDKAQVRDSINATGPSNLRTLIGQKVYDALARDPREFPSSPWGRRFFSRAADVIDKGGENAVGRLTRTFRDTGMPTQLAQALAEAGPDRLAMIDAWNSVWDGT